MKMGVRNNGEPNDKVIRDDRRNVLNSLRRCSAPYLPPPINSLVHAVDSYCHLNYPAISKDYCQSEPSAAIVSALLVAYLVWRSMQGLQQWWVAVSRRSTLHLSEEEDVLGGLVGGQGNTNRGTGGAMKGGNRDHPPPFQETVVLCGFSGSGKTALLHYLATAAHDDHLPQWRPPMTVPSLVANVAYIRACTTNQQDKPLEDVNEQVVRVIDYPGHPSLSSRLPSVILPSVASRLVFTLDSTQPVTQGAELLYHSILAHAQVHNAWKQHGKPLVVLILCTKIDVKGARNHKRLKIQVRNELDRLRKLDLVLNQASSSEMKCTHRGSSVITIHVKGKTLDLDDLGEDIPVSLHFVESGFGSAAIKGGAASQGLKIVRDFILNGNLPPLKR